LRLGDSGRAISPLFQSKFRLREVSTAQNELFILQTTEYLRFAKSKMNSEKHRIT